MKRISLGAADPNTGILPVKVQQLQLVDGDGPGLPLHLLALPGQVVELLAVDL